MKTFFHKLSHFKLHNNYEVVIIILIYLVNKHLTGTCFLLGNMLDSRM